MQDIKEILNEIKERKHQGSKNYYEPLPERQSKAIQSHYKSLINLPLNGSNISILNECGTVIGEGYSRIVVSDFGAYLEFSSEQIVKENIKQKWAGNPKAGQKYIWMHTKDDDKTKIYRQCGEVQYADYKVGMYYMDVLDAFTG